MVTKATFRRIAVAAALVATLAVAAACAGTSKDTALRTTSDGKAAPGGVSQPPSGATAIANGPDAAPAANDSAATGSTSAAPGDSGGAAQSLPATLDRKIIQTATLTITTDSVAKNFENVGNIAAGAGGFIASSSFGNDGANQTASITIRVPGDRYQDALIQLRKLGEVTGEKSDANDVTDEYTDLQSRVTNLQAVEAQYVQFLGRAQNLTDVLTVQDRLNATRAQIDQVQGRINLLQHQTDLATITVHLDPPPLAKPQPKTGGTRGPLEVAADSFQASLDVLLGIATVALAVAAFSWWLLPLLAIAAYIARRTNRPTRTPQPPPPVSPAT